MTILATCEPPSCLAVGLSSMLRAVAMMILVVFLLNRALVVPATALLALTTLLMTIYIWLPILFMILSMDIRPGMPGL